MMKEKGRSVKLDKWEKYQNWVKNCRCTCQPKARKEKEKEKTVAASHDVTSVAIVFKESTTVFSDTL